MSRGQKVTAPDGATVELVDIGHRVLLDADQVRVWEVELGPGELHPWHLHHNPYVVLSIEASPGRMDWLDGSPPRHLSEYVGGAVYRPVSPVHRLTNTGTAPYRNRLIEFKDLGELRPEPLDIGPGARSVQGETPPGARVLDGAEAVLAHPHVSVWRGRPTQVVLAPVPHLIARLHPPTTDVDPAGGVRLHPGGPLELDGNDGEVFVVELSYLQHLDTTTTAEENRA